MPVIPNFTYPYKDKNGNVTQNPAALAQGYVPSIDTVAIANGNAFAQNALGNEVNKQLAEKGFGIVAQPSKNNVVSAFNPLTTPNTAVQNLVKKAKKNSGSGGGVTADPYASYRGQLDDLYNRVMGYGSYTPGTYSAKYDTSGLEGQLAGWLNEIDNYGEFKYDLNADLLYKQMVDNSVQKGQMAAQDVMANAAALSGGYGNSYAASLGNQAYQQFLTDVNNNIPALQQQALNVWQAGLDQLYGQLDAGSQQLNNLLALEAQNFAQWQANEANAFNAWNAGYQQVLDQYNLGVDHANTMVSWAPQTVYSGGNGSSSSGNKGSSAAASQSAVNAVKQDIANAATGITNPLVSQAYLDYLETLKKK